MRTRHVVLASVVLAVLVAPFAAAAGDGTPLLGGQRNPSHGRTFVNETKIIAANDTFGTRQSNKGTGGGAIYGCRTALVDEACINATNLRQGRAFEFITSGAEGGRITAPGGDAARPFTTNATGVATGLNADRVDSKSASEIADVATARNLFAKVTDTGALSAGRGVASSARVSAGVYDVTLSSDVSACAPTATIVGTAGGQVSVSPTAATVVRVSTRDNAGAVADEAFTLLVTC